MARGRAHGALGQWRRPCNCDNAVLRNTLGLLIQTLPHPQVEPLQYCAATLRPQNLAMETFECPDKRDRTNCGCGKLAAAGGSRPGRRRCRRRLRAGCGSGRGAGPGAGPGKGRTLSAPFAIVNLAPKQCPLHSYAHIPKNKLANQVRRGATAAAAACAAKQAAQGAACTRYRSCRSIDLHLVNPRPVADSAGSQQQQQHLAASLACFHKRQRPPSEGRHWQAPAPTMRLLLHDQGSEVGPSGLQAHGDDLPPPPPPPPPAQLPGQPPHARKVPCTLVTLAHPCPSTHPWARPRRPQEPGAAQLPTLLPGASNATAPAWQPAAADSGWLMGNASRAVLYVGMALCAFVR